MLERLLQFLRDLLPSKKEFGRAIWEFFNSNDSDLEDSEEE